MDGRSVPGRHAHPAESCAVPDPEAHLVRAVAEQHPRAVRDEPRRPQPVHHTVRELVDVREAAPPESGSLRIARSIAWMPFVPS